MSSKNDSHREMNVGEVLLVEDNRDEAELLLRAFKRRNLVNPIHHVKDGRSAVDFLMGRGAYAHRKGQSLPSLVILDMKVPLMSGFEVLKTIRNSETLKTLPVVALTSSQLPSDINTCYDLGVNSYLVKPIEFDQFLEVAGRMGMYWLLLNKPVEGLPSAA